MYASGTTDAQEWAAYDALWRICPQTVCHVREVMTPLLRVVRHAFAVFVMVDIFSQAAFAAQMEHLDLTSLALEADLIVRARQTGERKVDEWRTIQLLTVTRSYKGDLRPGANIEVSLGAYSLVPFGADFDGRPGGVPKVGGELVLFLTRAVPAESRPEGQLYLVPSGLRIFIAGKAQRFQQVNNPGLYRPVPQRHDPFDVYGDSRAGEALDLPGLEAEIERAQERAKTVAAALAAADSPERRRRLVELSGPESQDEAPAGPRIPLSVENVASRRIVEALAAAADLESTLAAFARSSGVPTFGLKTPFSLSRLIDAAADSKLPVRSRVAALALVRERAYELRDAKGAEAKLLSLLGDGAWEVRAAALATHPYELSERMNAAFLARWKVEQDDRVRLEFSRIAGAKRLRRQLAAAPGKAPIVTATRRRTFVTISWADLDERVDWVATSARLVAKREGDPDRTVDLLEALNFSSSGNSSSGHDLVGCVSFAPPFLAGEPTLEVSVVLHDLNKRRPDEHRTFSLGAMPFAIASKEGEACPQAAP